MGDLTLDDLPSEIHTRFVHFTEVCEGDVQFLYELRSTRRGALLSDSVDRRTHEEFVAARIHDRHVRQRERYFILRDPHTSVRHGAVRITRLDDPITMGWESLIVESDASPTLAIDAILSVYSLAFQVLERQRLGPWRVRTANSHMLRIHEKLGFVAPQSGQANERAQEYIWLSVELESFQRDFPRWSRLGFGQFRYPSSWNKETLEQQ
jgi:hypothetical protein